MQQRVLNGAARSLRRASPRVATATSTGSPLVCRPCSAHATPQQQQQQAEPRTTFHHGITYVTYEVNTFSVKFNTSGVRVLVDPWFVGELTFAGLDWVYQGRKRTIGRTQQVDLEQVAAETDVLVLTQGLDDHTHMPTLKVFPKHVPVIACPSAAERIKPLGFKDVRVLDHGQSLAVADNRLRITATVGALVGPPWSKRQNGLVFRELVSDSPSRAPSSLYFESHCDFDAASVAKEAPVDIVVSPVVTASIGAGSASYPLTMGDINLEKLLKILKPKVLIPLLNSEIDQSGPLASIVQESGTYAGLPKRLADAGLADVRVEFPAPPGEAMAIAL